MTKGFALAHDKPLKVTSKDTEMLFEMVVFYC